MKFGLQYHGFRIPKWDAYYVDYNGLCQRIKDLSHQASTCESIGKVAEPSYRRPGQYGRWDVNGLRAVLDLEAETFRHIDQNISRFETFRLQIPESIARRENETCGVFGFPKTPISLPNIDSVEELELRVVRSSYEELLLELKEIQWFDKVNHTAFSKIFGKLANHSHDKKALEHCHSRWVALQQRLNTSWAEVYGRVDKLVAELRKELARSRLGTHSWCIASLISHMLPATEEHDMLYKSLKNDQHSLVEKHILSATAREFTARNNPCLFIADIILISIIFSAKHTTALALDFILCEQISAEHVFLIVRIYGMEFQRCLYQCQSFPTDNLDHTGHEFAKLLRVLGSRATYLLRVKDCQGCLLLHHAAHYGLDSLCKVMVSHLVDTTPTVAAETLISIDNWGRTPLHCAVNARSPSVLALLLNVLSQISLDEQLSSTLRATLGSILILTLRAGADEMAKMVLDHGPDLLQQSSRGETALYCAAQLGNLPLASLIVGRLSSYALSIDVVEQTKGWTPLMVACGNGDAKMTKLLLQAGSNQSVCDARGWTALEHAVFRGHHVVAELFKPHQPSTGLEGPANAIRTVHKTRPHAVCNAVEKILIVYLGSTQGSHDRATIQLGDFCSNTSNTFRHGCPLEMQIFILGAPSVAKTLPLPLLDDQSHKPLIFRVKHDMPLQVVLKVYRCDNANSRVLVSNGTSLLDQEHVLGDKYESLIRERTIYMMDKEKLSPSGTVLLSYVVARPYPGLKNTDASSCLRLGQGLVRLVGHRGLGQNVLSHSFLQLGENTVMSFLSAAKFGASFVEFDLQVTRDLEAVVYHDFSLSESGTDIPIHDTTLAQYRHVGDIHEPRNQASCSLDNNIQPCNQRRPRAWSSGEESASKAAQLRQRLQYAVDFQTKGFKPNSRGDVIQDSLTTLEELLVKLPLDIGFNIEIKYPRLHEAIEAGVAPVALKINTFVDVALDKLQKYAGKRPIVLSSFTPEVCILLSIKQTAYPVMFITNAGKAPVQDKELRGSSLQAAVHFARMWNLAGVVLACETFLYCPRLVQFVKNMGLICASYGLLNNEPINAKVQAAAGVDVLMVDRVKLIADYLGDYEPSKCSQQPV